MYKFRKPLCYVNLINYNFLSNFGIGKQLCRQSKFLFHCKLKPIFPCNALTTKGIYTSSVRNLNPALALIIRPISKFFAILVGRSIRKWWQSLPKDKKTIFWQHLVRNRWRYFGSVVACGSGTAVVLNHLIGITPYTDRKRLVLFDSSQMAQLADFQFKQDLENINGHVLAENHPHVLRTKRVCDRLLRASRTLPEIYTKFWTVMVVDSPEENCHVYPSGHIVMYKGMMDLTDNDDQLAIVLSHEISHAVLDHTAELIAFATFLDIAIIVPLAVIWAILPNDGVAAVAHWFFKRVVDTVFELPYSRTLEKEADALGLQLAAKACFDVREASAFWGRLDLIDKYKMTRKGESADLVPPQLAFLSTHPAHVERQTLIDARMNDAIKMRESCKCPNLNKFDPRQSVWALQEQFEAQAKLKNVSRSLL